MPSAQEWLNEWQRKSTPSELALLWRNVPPELLNSIFNALHSDGVTSSAERERFLSWARGIVSEAPEFEEPFLYHELQQILQNVLDVARQQSLSVPEDLCIGSLHKSEINAGANSLKSGHVIVVNIATALLVFSLSQIVSSFFKQLGQENGYHRISARIEDVRAFLDSNVAAHVLFVEVFVNYALLGNPRYWPNRILAQPHLYIALLANRAALMFIVAHEYWHLIIEDTTRKASVGDKVVRRFKLKKISEKWAKELSADYIAFRITTMYGLKQRYDIALSYLGMDFFLSCLEICEWAGVVGVNEETHPPSSLRREMLRWFLRRYFAKESEKALRLAEVAQEILQHLWNYNQETIRKIIAQQSSNIGR